MRVLLVILNVFHWFFHQNYAIVKENYGRRVFMSNLNRKKYKEETPLTENYINYTNLLYADIGNRVKKKLAAFTKIKSGKPKRMSLSDICDTYDLTLLTPSVLSRIQNGFADKQKNPYFMTTSMLNELAKLFDISVYQLVWGEEKEQEHYVKIWLLAVLFNGAKYKQLYPKKRPPKAGESKDQSPVSKPELVEETLNPFFESRVDFLIYTEEDLGNFEDRLLIESAHFFAEVNGYEKYNLLNVQHDPALLELSDTLFRLLLEDFEFAVFFSDSASNTISNRACLCNIPEKMYDKNAYDKLNEKLTKTVENSNNIFLNYSKNCEEKLDKIKYQLESALKENNVEQVILLAQIKDRYEIRLSTFKNIVPCKSDSDTDMLNGLEDLNSFKKWWDNEVIPTKIMLQDAEDLLYHPSKFIPEAIHSKRTHSIYFMKAFCRMWNIHKNDFMKFFREKIFQNAVLEDTGLKAFSNKNMDTIIKSKELLELVKSLHNDNALMNPESILSNTYFNQKIHATILFRYSIIFSNEHYLSTYMSMEQSMAEIKKAAQVFLESIKNHKDVPVKSAEQE